MEKIDRARIILGQTLSMDRSGGITESGANGDNFSNLIFRRVEVKSRWEATIMRRINSPDANMKTVSLSEWDLLTLRSNGELKLALRFFDGEVQIVIYRPGPWERWFGTYDIADREIIEPEKAVA